MILYKKLYRYYQPTEPLEHRVFRPHADKWLAKTT